MALSEGARLGPYEVLGSLGAGGMGEVYRARDTRLKRDVALKILPEAFAADPDRLARFQREAELLASLNHPHIAGIYGFEDSGQARALVLELVEGETLADRILRGAIPVDEALPIATQIVEALEAAHEQGIIHRDLKPSNIKITPAGSVKVLDFGLAKLHDANDTVSNSATGSNPPALSMSPTIMSPAMVTSVGVILGTAAYMAPEQAKGRAADKRSDIWSFGCVLYEMLTGRRAFEGDDVTDTLATILKGQPDWSLLPADAPPAVRTLVQRCLEKDRSRRAGDISVARFALEEAASLSPRAASAVSSRDDIEAAVRTARVPLVRSRRLVAAAGMGAALVVSAITGAAVWVVTRPDPPRVSRFELAPDTAQPFSGSSGLSVALAPDGSAIAYHGQSGGVARLLVRRMDELSATPVPATERSSNAFFSPDGTRIGFVSGAQLKTVALGGGAPTVICDVEGEVLGATWAGDVIVFAQAGAGLFRVPAGGGRPELVAAPDAAKQELDYRWPEVLPGGKAILYNVYGAGGARNARIVARRLDTGDTKVLVEGGNTPRYVPSGHLAYQVVPSTLMAAPFDPDALELRGPAVPVLSGLNATANGATSFAVASNGTFVYQRGAGSVFQGPLRFRWLSRDGVPIAPVASEVEGPRYPRLSPNGRALAVTIGASNQGNIWVIDLTGASQPRQLTFKGHNVLPTWSPDGKYLAFSSDRDGQRNLFRIEADGSALDATRLATGPYEQEPESWSPDGQSLLYEENGTKTRSDLMLLSIADGSSKAWLRTEFQEEDPSFSPDGQWVSYVSDQTGRQEVWVRPFPGPGAPIRVSPDGGLEPVWSRAGDELFYQSGQKMMAAHIAERAPALRFDAPRVLFEGGFVPYEPNVPRTYDVAPDGRFLMIQQPQRAAPATLVVVQHWFEELRRLAPSN